MMKNAYWYYLTVLLLRTCLVVTFQCPPVTKYVRFPKLLMVGAFETSENEDMPIITIEDIFQDKKVDEIVSLVDDMESLQEFSNTLSEQANAMEDKEIGLVGIDCEWRPDTLVESEESQLVMTLQICLYSLGRVFLLDMKELNANEQLKESFADTIVALWKNPKLLKVGYQHQQDLLRLAVSYPQLGAFGNVEGVLDIKPVARKVLQITGAKKARLVEESLGRMTAYFLKSKIDKTQQMSDWGERPLTPAQVSYAALDSTLVVELLSRLMDIGKLEFFPALGRKKKDKAFGKMVSSQAFTVMANDKEVQDVSGVRIRRCLGRRVACQEWVTGSDPPPAPSPEPTN